MERNCIICGKNCEKVVCVGTKSGMQAIFCDEHTEYCDDCETMECITLTNQNNIN